MSSIASPRLAVHEPFARVLATLFLPDHQLPEIGMDRRDILEVAHGLIEPQLGDVVRAELGGLSQGFPAPVGIVVHQRCEGAFVHPARLDRGVRDLQDRPGGDHDVAPRHGLARGRYAHHLDAQA